MPEIHLFNPMRNAFGGSEQRTITLFEILSESELTTIWSNEAVDPAFLGRIPIKAISFPQSFPKKGTFVFMGTYQSLEKWAEQARPGRVIVVQNLNDPARLRVFREALLRFGFPEPEIVYASPQIQAMTPEFPGVVQESPIDLERFHPARQSHDGFVVGRHSRDVPEKHHPNDPELYQELAAKGFRIKVMGGECLSDSLPNVPGIELMPIGSVPPEQFLNGLDAFLYRTHPLWVEAFGRVTIEAMACGVPAFVEREQPIADFLNDGEGCFFIGENNDEIIARLEELRSDQSLCEKQSAVARDFIERKMGEEWKASLTEYYLR